jgi:SAM-dependent methyltransferase
MKTLEGVQQRMPRWLRRYVLHFEAAIEDAAAEFGRSLSAGSLLLDAGAGEGQYRKQFSRQRYLGIDLGIGDAGWNYAGLDAVADLQQLPLRSGSVDAVINIVTLEHVTDPARVLEELCRVLRRDGRLLLVVPHEWEEHQQPHDFYRYTRYGVEHLLKKAGFQSIEIRPVGGYFRLLARRILNGLQFFPGPLVILAALVAAPAALVLPLLEPLDQKQHFTLGFICLASKS